MDIDRVLKAGGLVFALFDGIVGRGTVTRPFFGRVCHFRRALVELAARNGAAIVPVAVRMNIDGRILVEFHEAISDVGPNVPPKTAALRVITRLVDMLENEIKRHPWSFEPGRIAWYWKKAGAEEGPPRPR